MAASVDNDFSQTQPASAVPEVSQVYAQFAGLAALAKQHFSGELGGKLLLYEQLDARGAAVTLAANIAGAATLGVDSDTARLRQGIRHGFCDFVVNHLDEALRILKNEVRKKQPVSVCLEGDLAATLREAVERGLQPDLLAVPTFEGRATVQILIERGAISVAAPTRPDDGLTIVTWSADSAPARWLPKVDALATRVLPESDERARWLKLAPRYLGRMMAVQRSVAMTTGEAERFSGTVAAAVASGEIGTKITIQPQ